MRGKDIESSTFDTVIVQASEIEVDASRWPGEENGECMFF